MSVVTSVRGHGAVEAQTERAPDHLYRSDQMNADAHASSVGAEPSPCPVHDMHEVHSLCDSAGGHDLASDHGANDAQRSPVAGDDSPPVEPTPSTFPKTSAARLEDALLLIYADALDDLERVRIATDNRVRALRDVKGMEDSAEEARLLGLADSLKALEHGAELELKRAVRKHPLGPWIKATIGIGEKQGARLLAAIGDPASRRTVSQLWAYCGLHVLHPGHTSNDSQGRPAGVDHLDSGQQWHETQGRLAGVAPRRARGQKANWNAIAKMRSFLVAESCIKKADSPYRPVYDAGRAKYADAVHAFPCSRCGPSGKPALAGSPLSAGHQHARAMRLVMKAVLRDLWVEARRVSEAA